MMLAEQKNPARAKVAEKKVQVQAVVAEAGRNPALSAHNVGKSRPLAAIFIHNASCNFCATS